MIRLQALEASLFAAVAVLAAWILTRRGRRRSAGAPPADAGVWMRRLVVTCLLLASAARGLCLVVGIVFEDAGVPDQQRYESDVLGLLPGCLFLSAFSVVVLVWAQIHYAMTLNAQPDLGLLFGIMNGACYLLVGGVTVCALLRRNYSFLRNFLFCAIGFLDTAVAALFFAYGLLLVADLRGVVHRGPPGAQLTWRVVALLVVCPPALLLHGGYYLAWGCLLERRSRLGFLALCLLGEWLPSLAVLAGMSPSCPGGGRKSRSNSMIESSDSEPLLQEDPEHLQSPACAPGQTWKQIHPHPVST